MSTALHGLQNLGHKIISMLESIGVRTLEDIASVGPAYIQKTRDKISR